MNIKKINEKKGFVSIIIPTYNRKHDLDRCLRSIFKQSYKKKEVIVVDDYSSDNTIEYIKKNYSQVKVIRNKKNKGPNYCRNRGIIYSQGEYILILDSDVELINKFHIKNMIKIINSDSKIGTIGGSYMVDDPRIKSNILKGNIYFDSKDKYILKKSAYLLMECDFVGANNLFVRKKLLYELGGFDEFLRGDCIDLEFGLNLKQKEYINLFGPDIVAKHYKSFRERDNLGLQINPKNANKKNLRKIWRQRNRIRFFIKNFHTLKNKVSFLISATDFIKLLTEPISILAFIKQQFLGLKTKDSENIPSFKKKIERLRFKIRLILDPLLWNLVHYKQTIKCRNINFLEYNKCTFLN